MPTGYCDAVRYLRNPMSLGVGGCQLEKDTSYKEATFPEDMNIIVTDKEDMEQDFVKSLDDVVVDIVNRAMEQDARGQSPLANYGCCISLLKAVALHMKRAYTTKTDEFIIIDLLRGDNEARYSSPTNQLDATMIVYQNLFPGSPAAEAFQKHLEFPKGVRREAADILYQCLSGATHECEALLNSYFEDSYDYFLLPGEAEELDRKLDKYFKQFHRRLRWKHIAKKFSDYKKPVLITGLVVTLISAALFGGYKVISSIEKPEKPIELNLGFTESSQDVSNMDNSGAAEHSMPNTKYQSQLIRDPNGNVVGIIFDQITDKTTGESEANPILDADNETAGAAIDQYEDAYLEAKCKRLMMPQIHSCELCGVPAYSSFFSFS